MKESELQMFLLKRLNGGIKGSDDLRSRGINTAFTDGYIWSQEVLLDSYGRSDLIGLYDTPYWCVKESETPARMVHIIELKAVSLRSGHINQLLRYKRGVFNSFFNHHKSGMDIQIRTTLITKEGGVSENCDFTLFELMCHNDFDHYTYKVSKDGCIYFKNQHTELSKCVDKKTNKNKLDGDIYCHWHGDEVIPSNYI